MTSCHGAKTLFFPSFFLEGFLTSDAGFLLSLSLVFSPRRKTDESIECTMPPAALPHADQVSVCVQFEDLPCQSAELSTTFSYEKNPVISDIRPERSYLRYAGPGRGRTAGH